MQSKPQDRDAFELFQSYFDQLLTPAHELVQPVRKLALSFEGIDRGRVPLLEQQCVRVATMARKRCSAAYS